MLLLVPDELRAEVMGAGDDALLDLKTSGRVLTDKGLSSEQIRTKLLAAGWSPAFCDWYVTRLELDGSNLELRVARKSIAEEEQEVYDRWRALKTRNQRVGWALVLCSAFPRLVVMQLIDPSQFVVALLSLITIGMYFPGLFMVLDSKGQSRWYAIFGFWIVFASDKNKMTPPSKRSAFTKDSASALSDW